jgi:hypothetical protein
MQKPYSDENETNPSFESRRPLRIEVRSELTEADRRNTGLTLFICLRKRFINEPP